MLIVFSVLIGFALLIACLILLYSPGKIRPFWMIKGILLHEVFQRRFLWISVE